MAHSRPIARSVVASSGAHAVDNVVAPLFVPADRPERFTKAAMSGADALILDLEDAVAPANKAFARAELRTDFTDLPVIVRVNAAGAPGHEDDVAAAARLQTTLIMLPKAERLADIMRVAALRPVIALIETVRGIAEARAIAASGYVRRLAFGSVDYAADLGCEHVRDALAPARAEIIFASRLAGLPAPLDGVTTDIANIDVLTSDALHARSIGFGGKLAIHPSQLPAIHKGFRPDEREIAWAKRVLSTGDGAVMMDGSMVDEPVRARARAILMKADSAM